nr:TauD/TfdA family dioxygenase [Streptomyces sp. MBT65]
MGRHRGRVRSAARAAAGPRRPAAGRAQQRLRLHRRHGRGPPRVRLHPVRAGERALLLGGFARRAAGLAPQASRDVLRLLQEYVTIPEHTVRWRWRPGDLAIWDNRATQHYAVFDYGTRDRRAERCTVTGTVPVGIDGRPSTVLSGDTTAYSDGRR